MKNLIDLSGISNWKLKNQNNGKMIRFTLDFANHPHQLQIIMMLIEALTQRQTCVRYIEDVEAVKMCMSRRK